ncbi:MAG: hypothetical protein ACI4KM_11880 [Oscillospiraceae bacterium]
MEVFEGVLILAYWAAGYWATGWTIYYNKIVIEFQPGGLFVKRAIWGLFLGWILIPVAIIRKILLSKG